MGKKFILQFFYIVASALKSCLIFWEIFFGESKSSVFRPSCFGYFGYHSKSGLSETPFFTLLDITQFIIYYKCLEDFFILDIEVPKLAFDPTYYILVFFPTCTVIRTPRLFGSLGENNFSSHAQAF